MDRNRRISTALLLTYAVLMLVSVAAGVAALIITAVT